MNGRHAAADDVDDQALADQPHEPGAHVATGEPGAESQVAPVDAKPPVSRTGRRAKGATT